MMMIGKELLSGFWVCPECLSWFAITSHLRSVSLSVSLSFHHFSCHTALSLLTTKWYIVSCLALWSLVPHSAVLLYSQPLYGDVGDVAFLVLFCLPPYSIRRWFNVITPLSAFWRCWTGQPFTFSLWCAFFVCLLVVLCVWFVFVLFAVSLLLWDCDGSWGYVSVLASSTFEAFFNSLRQCNN